MKYVLTLAAAFLFLFSHGQTDTGRIYNRTVLRPGFYKDYREYIDNAPSITVPVDFTYISISKNDSAIIGATYKTKDGSKITGHLWGFCDGKDVYIEYSPSLLSTRYWRLESLGPHPFFSYPDKTVAAMGPPLMAVATVALTASQPPLLKLRTIDEDGKTSVASLKRVEEWLEPEPDLLAAFRRTGYKHPNTTDRDKTEARFPDTYKERMQAIREYLLKLNQRLLQKAQQR
jgi:hypothetical protein